MDSEEVQFTSAQSPTDEPTTHQQEHPAALHHTASDQAAETAEATSAEATSSTKKRRRRPSRGGARRSHTSETEQHTDESEPEHEAGVEEPETHQEAYQEAKAPSRDMFTLPWGAASATREAPEAPASRDFFQAPEIQPAAPMDAQEAPDFFGAFAASAAAPQTPGEAPGQPAWSFYTESLGNEPLSFTPETPTEPAPGAEPPAQTSQEAEAMAAPEASQAEESPYEPFRAPLSGVEVRPPRRYRFDRPAPVIHDLRRPALQAKPAAPPARPFHKEPAFPKPLEESAAPGAAGASIERALTATPEVAADVAAAEELARATQAALEEEIAEEQVAPEAAPAPEETEAAPSAPEATSTPSSRRRRRRRSNASATAAAAESTSEAAPVPPVAPVAPTPFAPPAAPGAPYHVSTGLQQLGQPQSPFSGPEPSSARGFGPVPRGVARPAERGVQMPRPERAVEPGAASINQLATIFTQAVQQQTDRLLMELRRNQGAPSMTVNFPPMPSTERVGVFVDVANLLYSARNMRISIDFGRLLDFLRGNRRLVRAHAYCPTSPDPRAEQMFLDAVKGLGYRITTKNYKTFSSGAKKADLDLDLCMDIVRLVDAGAVDCISLVSGDSDFLPLLEYCSDHGVRVEVAAFDEATASILRQSCDLFINLSLVEEIRA